MTPYRLVLHGGAGDVDASSPKSRLDGIRAGLGRALAAGTELLSRGESALDAVVTAVRALEDDPHFNAGHGAVLQADGVARMDASVMCGKTEGAGAVIGVKHLQNPILAARALLDAGREVMLSGDAAERWAAARGLALRDAAYFVTEYRREQLAQAQESPVNYGQTVGAVALDVHGNLAAATSTGGRQGAPAGRVGDSPIIGAGTWARNGDCAVSATGAGEYFVRTAFAHAVSARCRWGGLELEASAEEAVSEIVRLGGMGGCIAIGPDGRVAAPFTTRAMSRAMQDGAGERWIRIFRGE